MKKLSFGGSPSFKIGKPDAAPITFGPGGGVRPSTGAALLTWDGHASTLLIQWDGDDGLPRYLEWDT